MRLIAAGGVRAVTLAAVGTEAGYSRGIVNHHFGSRRALLDAVGTRTVAFEDAQLRSYDGGWAEFARVREERREAEASAAAAVKQERRATRSQRNGRPRSDGPSKNAIRRLGDLERDVERKEEALREIEDELADPTMWSSPSRTERNTERHAAAKKAVEEAYAAWEKASAQS